MGVKEFERPFSMRGITTKVKTPHGSMFVTINFYEREPKEVFVVVSKPGSEIRACAEALGRVISLALQKGISAEDIVETLENIKTEEVSWNRIDGMSFPISSIPDGIAKAMKFALSLKHTPDTILNYSVEIAESKSVDISQSEQKLGVGQENMGGENPQSQEKSSSVGLEEAQSSRKKKSGGKERDDKSKKEILHGDMDESVYYGAHASSGGVLNLKSSSAGSYGSGEGSGVKTLKGGDFENSSFEDESKFSVCPKCHSNSLSFQEGCYICMNCGYTKCS